MADQLSRVFSALADPTRRDMVARLAVTDATVNELAEPYSVTIQAVSKHLKVLEEAGLVSRSRDAQRRPVHLEAEVFDLMTKWIERYRRQAEERFRRLDDAPGGDERCHDDCPRATGSRRMTTRTHETEIVADPNRPDHLDHTRVRRSAASKRVPCLHRSGTVRAGGSGRAASDARIDRWDAQHRRALSLPRTSVTARRSPRSTARSTRCAPASGSSRPSRGRVHRTACRSRR